MKRKQQTPRANAGKKPGQLNPSSSRLALPLWKKLLFATVVIAGFFVGSEILLALIGVRPVQFERDPYVGFSSSIPLFVKDPGANDPDGLVTAKNKQRFFNTQRFSARKPKDTCRIFCMGGSTTYGHPYEDPTSFCGWLRATLPRVEPSRRWELINCGGISYASYREALLMEELIQYQPDLFIVFSGQNEFLEQRTYGNIISMPASLRGAGALLTRTRVHTAIKAALNRLRPVSADSGASSNALPGEVETLLERVVGPQAYHRDETLRRQVMEHFRFNLARMVDIAASVGARVILVSPASNLRACSPFKSEHRPGLTEDDLRKWQTHLQRAKTSAAASRWNEVLAALDQAGMPALVIDDHPGAAPGRARTTVAQLTERHVVLVTPEDRATIMTKLAAAGIERILLPEVLLGSSDLETTRVPAA